MSYQILPARAVRDVWTTVRRTWILILGFKGKTHSADLLSPFLNETDQSLFSLLHKLHHNTAVWELNCFKDQRRLFGKT